MHRHVRWHLEIRGKNPVSGGRKMLQPIDLPKSKYVSAALHCLTQGQGGECGELQTKGPL